MSASAILRRAAARAPCRRSTKLLDLGAKSLVFDLRDNPGGLLSELITILDHLLPQGDLFVSVDGSGKETVTQSDSVCVKVPMAVIVNGNTYSAAEFFAAALREYDWRPSSARIRPARAAVRRPSRFRTAAPCTFRAANTSRPIVWICPSRAVSCRMWS